MTESIEPRDEGADHELSWVSIGVYGVMWVEALKEADPQVFRDLERDGKLRSLAKFADARLETEYAIRRNLLLRTRALIKWAPLDVVRSLLEEARAHAVSLVLPRRHDAAEGHQGGWDLASACRLVSRVTEQRVHGSPHSFRDYLDHAFLVTELEADWHSHQTLMQTLRASSRRKAKSLADRWLEAEIEADRGLGRVIRQTHEKNSRELPGRSPRSER